MPARRSRTEPRRQPNAPPATRERGELAVQKVAEARNRTRTPLATAPAIGTRGKHSFLTSEHPIHAAWTRNWLRLERAMKGGLYMTKLLRRYDWELENGDSIRSRIDNATYINFPDAFASGLLGYMMRQAPKPGAGLSFGSMGRVNDREASGGRVVQPTRADLIYYNVDGIGQDGSEWDRWWFARGRNAMAFGHTWILEENPSVAPTRRDAEYVNRPYLVECKPYRVWDWHFEEGVLQYAIIRYEVRRPSIDANGAFTNTGRTRYYLLTRAGWDGFGPDFSGGGFWLFDHDRNPMASSENRTTQGNFDELNGEIPLHPLFWERDAGVEGYEAESTLAELPSMSRSAVMELANIAESYMNLSSAADFEAWDGAKGVDYLAGVTEQSFNLAVAKMREGNRMVPLIASGPNAIVPQVVPSSAGMTASSIFNDRLANKREEARIHAAIDRAATPDASGVSKEATFADITAPRLASFASELQTAQNTAIRNLELRFGAREPSGSVTWPRKFDLLEASQAIEQVFDAVSKVGIKSKTLFAKGTTVMLREKGAITDDATLTTIEAEIGEGMDAEAANSANLAARTADLRNPVQDPAPADGQ